MRTGTPIFTGWHAVVLHRPDAGTDKLARQLRLLGLAVTCQWAPLETAERPADLVLVDADQGWDGLFAWAPGAAPVPVVALLGSEAPGRIAWALGHGAGSIIAKPITTAAVYPALVLAAHAFAERRAVAERVGELEERLRLRPVVFHAMKAIMTAHHSDEDAAFGMLRRVAMQRRVPIEHVAAAIAAGLEPLPEAM